MGLRFRKSKDFGFGRINLSKSGIGFSTGVKGFRMTKKTNGGNRTTISIPGTGMSYVKDSSKRPKKKSAKTDYSEDIYDMDDLNEDEEFDYSEPITQTAYNNASNQYINNVTSKKKSKAGTTLLWILGWLLIFPIPLTILLVRNRKLKQGIKVPIIVFTWLVYLIFAWAFNLSDEEKTLEEATITETIEEKVEEAEVTIAETTTVASVEEKETEISMPITSEICKGMDYKKVSDLLKEAGFKDVTTTKQEFDDTSEYEEGTVVKVIVDGKESFDMKDSFEDDKKVEIFYATIKASEVVQEKEKIDEKVETKTETEANSSVTEEVNVPQKDDSKELKTAIQELAATMFVTKTVNVRANPSLDGEKVGSLSLNDEVNVTGKTDDGWYRIQYGDGEAYVKEGFFSNSRAELPVQTSVVNSETVDTTTVTSSSNSSDSGDHVVVPTQADTEGNLVWVPTNGGKKYHSKPTCSGMIDPIQVTIEHAEENGYTACKKCH